ncbi:MAG: conjugal transfer protein TraX [Saccharofermentans sp.]|nr:conjugal transfer protein TraX [Saccharofermentans sp.]
MSIRYDKLRILDGTVLKIIAMVSMVFDHAGDMFFPDVLWPRMIGRLAMPLFAFCITEGYIHTRDKKKYLFRMGIFALVSEVPFDLAFEGKVSLNHQNIMLTFFMSILALMLFDLVRGKINEDTGRYSIGKTILGSLVIIGTAAVAILIKADYTIFAVISVFLFYLFKDTKHFIRTGVGVAFLALTRTMGYYCTTGLSIIPLLLYNGKKGKGLKWLFYAFYPGHLMLLYLIKLIVNGQLSIIP